MWYCHGANIWHYTTVMLVDLQDFINQLISMETVITQARSLRAKFATCKKEEDTAEIEEWVRHALIWTEPELDSFPRRYKKNIFVGCFVARTRLNTSSDIRRHMRLLLFDVYVSLLFFYLCYILSQGSFIAAFASDESQSANQCIC